MTIYTNLPYVPYFYIIQDTRNGMYYAGSKYGKNSNPKTLMIEGGYTTTSKTVKRIIKEFGLKTFIVRKIITFDTKFDAQNYETKFLRRIDARNHKLFYNAHNNDWTLYDNKNKVTVKDKNGTTFQASISDEKYLSGELVGASKGCKPGIIVGTSIVTNFPVDDPRWKTGELISPKAGKSHYQDENGNSYFLTKEQARSKDLLSFSKNKVTVKDEYGNTFRIEKDDPRYLSGKLVGVTKGKIPTKDKNGNTVIVEITDERILSGELAQVNKNMVVVIDKEGNRLRVSKNDPRYLSRELVGVSSGMTFYNNGKINRTFRKTDIIPSGFIKGRIKIQHESSN